MIIWEGTVEVKVSHHDFITDDYNCSWFENINRGTCFNVYCPFSDEMKQLVNFYALTPCVIYKINVDDLFALGDRYKNLKDKLKMLKMRVGNKEVSNMDYFRF